MTAKKRVLVVDDDPAVTDLLQAKLGTVYEVVTTNDSTQVLALAKAHRPALILCDLDMPNMDGGDVWRALNKEDQTRDTPFLYLTSFVSPQEVEDLGGVVSGRPGISKRAPIKQIMARIAEMIGA